MRKKNSFLNRILKMTDKEGVYEFVPNESGSKACLVKCLIKKTGNQQNILSDLLGYPQDTFKTKMKRNAFSFDDILMIADKCGLELVFINKETGEQIRVGADHYFGIGNEMGKEEKSEEEI